MRSPFSVRCAKIFSYRLSGNTSPTVMRGGESTNASTVCVATHLYSPSWRLYSTKCSEATTEPTFSQSALIRSGSVSVPSDSSILSISDLSSFLQMNERNSGKSIVPPPSSSNSDIIFVSDVFEVLRPSAFAASLNSFRSMSPARAWGACELAGFGEQTPSARRCAQAPGARADAAPPPPRGAAEAAHAARTPPARVARAQGGARRGRAILCARRRAAGT